MWGTTLVLKLKVHSQTVHIVIDSDKWKNVLSAKTRRDLSVSATTKAPALFVQMHGRPVARIA